MTAWNHLAGALIVKGYSEREALNMIWDLLHEEGQRLRNIEPPKTLDPTGRAWTTWQEAMRRAASELDPDDPSWEARCNDCYLPWSIDHVCHIGWYDWLRTNKTVIADALADAVAQVDATMWHTRVPNEDDPMWVKYRTYGDACWEQLLEAIRSEGKKDIAKAKEAADTQLPVDPDCETRDARTCTTSCTVHGEPEKTEPEKYPKWCTAACNKYWTGMRGACACCWAAEDQKNRADREAIKAAEPKQIPGEEIFDRQYRWVMQVEAEVDDWRTHTVERTEDGAKSWLETKRRQWPDTACRAVKETRTYTVEDW